MSRACRPVGIVANGRGDERELDWLNSHPYLSHFYREIGGS